MGDFPILPGAPPSPGGGVDTGLLLGLVLGVISFLNALVAALAQIFTNLGDFLNTFLDITGKSLANIWKALKTLGHDIITLHFGKLLHDLRDDIDKIRKWAKKLHDWLEKLQRMQRQMQLQALRRIVNLIQRIRQILLPFRLLHLKFAQKLDAWLSGVEAKIITRELAIVLKTNEIIGWLNVILDPTALFRSGPLWNAIGRDIRAVLGAVDAVGFEKLFPALVRGPMQPAKAVTLRPWVNDFLPAAAGARAQFDEFKAGALAVWQGLRDEVGT